MEENNIRLAIDQESVNIYIETSGEPIHLVYWHLEEVEEDATVAISIANAIRMFYENPKQLLKIARIGR